MSIEEYEKVLKDISDKLEGANDLDWSEIQQKYSIKCNSDTIRKASSTIFGGHFRTEYLKSKIYSNPDEFSKEREIDKKLEDMRKERIKLQTLNIERNRLDRNESRQELYYQYVGNTCTSLPLPEFQPLIVNDSNGIDYLVTIADVHYGASFKSENNVYSPLIVKDRFEYLTGKLIEFVNAHNVTTLHIASLGDMLQGLIRLSDLKLNDSTVVKSVVELSRLIALFLNELSRYVRIEYYHVPTANHTQIRVLGAKASELADEDLEYVIGHYISDLCQNNSRINVHLAKDEKQYIDIPIKNNNIVAMHGHQIKSIDSSLKDLSMIRKSFVDYLILGHFHAGKELPCSEGLFKDTEILVSSSFVGSDPYSDSIMKGSKASVKIYGFSDTYGHTESYKIILN